MTYHDITVVITTFRSEIKIISCLESINSELQVIVVENSNNTDFKKNIENKFRNVKCILSGENLGYAKGNNLGLSKVKTKYALIINPDAVLEKNAINNFLITANKNLNFAIISPLIQEEKDLLIVKENSSELKEIENVKGFAMFLNLENFKDIGFFDDNFFIYFEEIDLCRRLINNKQKIYLDPTIRVHHIGGSSHDNSVNYEMELSRNWHWMWSTFYYHKKYNSFILALIKVMPKLFSSFIKIIFYLLIFKKDKRAIYWQRFSGLFNSIIGRKSWYRPKVN
jgi:N-acetylglucosaminyl-diphospho-decaprenol L-rhamnosyltransferase